MPSQSKAPNPQEDAQLREIDALVEEANAREAAASREEPDESAIARELGISVEELQALRETSLA